MFTDRLILGNQSCPEYLFISVCGGGPLADIQDRWVVRNKLMDADYLPLVSVGSGLCKCLAGIVHSVAHLGQAVFADQAERSRHLQEASLGAKSIIRGAVAAPPVVGNIALFCFDRARIKQTAEKFAKFEKGFAILYGSDGQEISRISAREYYAATQERFSIQQIVRTILHGTPSPVSLEPIAGFCLETERVSFSLANSSGVNTLAAESSRIADSLFSAIRFQFSKSFGRHSRVSEPNL